MKISRNQLRKIIRETLEGAQPALGPDMLQSKLREFHNLTMKLDGIYNHHQSWNMAPEEQKLIDRIYVVREELYSMGLRPDHVNQVKDMSYEEFDALMGMSASEFKLWKES